jgi:hypothetical protein
MGGLESRRMSSAEIYLQISLQLPAHQFYDFMLIHNASRSAIRPPEPGVLNSRISNHSHYSLSTFDLDSGLAMSRRGGKIQFT